MIAACPVCGESFDTSASAGTPKSYCSKRCRITAQKSRRHSRRDELLAIRKRREAKVRAALSELAASNTAPRIDGCGWCGKNLSGRRRLWCSRDCMVLARNAASRREKKPPTAYQSVRREFNKIRRGFLAEHPVCECGGRATQVHHITQIRFGGTNDTANLVALCSRCHYERHPELPPKLREGLLLH